MGFAPEPKSFTGTGNIRVGTAGWSYPDWKGRVYPSSRPSGFSEPGYLADYFDVLEINTSFYRPVAGTTALKWVRQVSHNPRFRFTAKLHQNFTHSGGATPDDERAFHEMAGALAGADRLGAVLVQFPWSFRNNAENRGYLTDLLARFRQYPMVVETRHASWDDIHFLELLREAGAAFCNIDQPVIGKSLEPSAMVTSNVGYVRLHGRNYKEWFGESGRDARYNYLYGKDELKPWKERIEQVASKTSATYVIANNHYQGQAAANALELISLLLGGPVRAPDPLVAAYPRLEECTIPEQGRLWRAQ